MVSASEMLPEGTATTTVNYDTSGNLASIVNPLNHVSAWHNYNGLGLPASVVDANGVTTSYTYNTRGNLLTQTAQGRTTTYTYNHDRQVATITYPSGSVTRYQYNAAGRLEYVNTGAGEPTHMAVDMASNSLRTSAARHYAEFNGGTPYAVGSTEFSSKTVLDSLGRAYTELGNKGQRVEKRYDNNGNLRTSSDAKGRVTSYAYDAANRLKNSTAPDGAVTTFVYDIRGNLESVTDPRGLETSYTYNGFGQVTSVVSPDTGTTNFLYDAAARLSTETKSDGTAITYSWDILGRRLGRVSGSISERLNYDEEVNGIGRLTSFSDSIGETRYTYNAHGEITSQKIIFGEICTPPLGNMMLPAAWRQ